MHQDRKNMAPRQIKPLAQIAYETFSASFGIDTEQLIDRRRSVRSAIPWENLARGEKKRWEIVALAVKTAMQDSIVDSVRERDRVALAEHERRTMRGDIFEQEIRRQIQERQK